jgi:hypothetical protein
VHAANGACMTIQHIGQSTLSTPSHNILLKNVLHVPQATHNFASIHCLTSDNDVFLELHPTFFLIKDWLTRPPEKPSDQFLGLIVMNQRLDEV